MKAFLKVVSDVPFELDVYVLPSVDPLKVSLLLLS